MLKKMLRINDASNDKSTGAKKPEPKKTDRNIEEVSYKLIIFQNFVLFAAENFEI